jgi:hypothetical protein
MDKARMMFQRATASSLEGIAFEMNQLDAASQPFSYSVRKKRTLQDPSG